VSSAVGDSENDLAPRNNSGEVINNATRLEA